MEVNNTSNNQPELNLTLTRLDPQLLKEYFHIIDNDANSSLQLRFQLLKLELNELEDQQRRQNPIFAGDEVNILPQRDCNKPRKRSKTLKRKQFKASDISKLTLPNVRIFLEDDLTFGITSPKLDDFEDLENPKVKDDHDDQTKQDVQDDSISTDIKLEIVKTEENQRTSEPDQPRRKRGRPKRKQVTDDDSLEHLSCNQCSFIGISIQVLFQHKQEAHLDEDEDLEVKREQFIDDPSEWNDFNYDYEDLFSSPSQQKKKKKDISKDTPKLNLPLELIKCTYCDQDVDRKRMEHHMYSKHKDVKMHICDQCPFKTNSLINLTRHIDNMHLAINTWPCPECPLQCGSPHALRKHVDRIHRNIQNYMCELCSYRTSTGSELRTHMEMKHTATDRFKCDKCEFATALKRNLERHHIRVHSHIKPFSCPMQGCGYQATEKGDIDKHVKRVHMGMRRYQCHILTCEFKIDSKSKWLEHLAVEHRLSPQEIEEISLKRKRTRIGGAHRKAALLQSAPVNNAMTSSPAQGFIMPSTIPSSGDTN